MAKSIKDLQEALEAAEAAIAWERKIPELLLNLGFAFQEAEDAKGVYDATIAAVCHDLDWDEGRVFLAKETNGAQCAVLEELIPSSKTDGEAGAKPSAVSSEEAIELAQRAAKTGEPAWNAPILLSLRSGGRMRQSSSDALSVAVPVKLSGAVVAVLVFSSRRVVPEVESSRKFFDLLADKIGATLKLQEVTRREREQAIALVSASKMSVLGEVAAGIAHEIRNPVSAIATLCQIVRRMAMTDPIDGKMLLEQVERIERSLQRVTSIVSDLQDFSRDASRDPFVEVALREVLSQTLTLCRAKFMKDRIALHVEDLPPDWKLECHPSQVSQVLLNLLMNAYDATKGLPGAWVKVDALDRGESLELAISNCGPPIPPELADRIMDPFFTTKPPGKGTGLGLSISSSIAKGHNGDLWLDRSSPTPRFVLVLPKRQPVPGAPHESAA